MAVTWDGNPVVLGGWRAEGADTKVATDKVWRVVNSRWVELPPLLQPRAAGAAAVVGDRLVVTGGVGANGKLLNTTEVFDGNSWTLGAEMPTPRQMLGAAADDKVVYAVGGNDGTADLPTVEAYDPAADSWTTLPALPQPRSDLGVAIADARLVAVGGLSAGQVLKSVAVMDLATKTWAGLPDMSTARHGMAVAAVDKSVYAIGGATGVDDTQVTSAAEALKLAPRKLQPASEWRSLPDAPTPRLMMAWTVLDDKIWIAGGMSHGTTLQIVQSYDPQTGAWQAQPPLPIPLHHATAATYRGEVVVIGGASDELADASNKVFALRGDSWVELPSLTHARAAAAAAVVGDKLVVVGGQNEKQLVPQTEVFDGQSWKDAADLPTPREHLAAVSDGFYVYTVGGRFLSADKNSAAFERFDPQSGEWTKLVDMPTPRGSYGATFIDGRIVALGGEEPTRVLAHGRDVRHRRGEVDRTAADTDGAARRGGRHRRRHRVLHRRRESADTRRSCRDCRGPGLHVAASRLTGGVPRSPVTRVPPSRSMARVTAPRLMASLARRTRRSPSAGTANLSYKFCRCCLMAASVTKSSSAIWRTDASSGNGSPETKGRHRTTKTSSSRGVSRGGRWAGSTVSVIVVVSLLYLQEDQP